MKNYIQLFLTLENRLPNSTIIFCSADFDTYWERINQKDAKSKKELFGKEVNKLFHAQHTDVFEKCENEKITKKSGYVNSDYRYIA